MLIRTTMTDFYSEMLMLLNENENLSHTRPFFAKMSNSAIIPYLQNGKGMKVGSMLIRTTMTDFYSEMFMLLYENENLRRARPLFCKQIQT